MAQSLVNSAELVLDLPDGSVDAVVARPGDAGPERRYPPVLFIMDANGLRPRLVEMAERIASWGYVVLIPNVYYRESRPPVIPPDSDGEAQRSRMMELLASYTPQMWSADGPAYLDALTARDDATDTPVRITGYCMGGELALRLAAQRPERVGMVTGFHTAGLVTDAPDSPHRLLDTVTAPLYFLYADDDPWMTPEAQHTMAQAASEADVEYTAEVARGAPHGYTMADRPTFHAAAEARHWQALRERFTALA